MFGNPPKEKPFQTTSLYDVILRGIYKTGFTPPDALLRAMGHCVQELIDQQPIEDEIISNIIINAMMDIFEYLPRSYFVSLDEAAQYDDWKGPTVPLHDALANCGKAVIDVAGNFFHTHLLENGYFRELRKQLQQNEDIASKISPTDRILGRKDVIGADESELPPKELVYAYLHDTPLSWIFDVQVPFIIPQKTFASHGIILAPPNHGKTQLLGSIIACFLGGSDSPGIFVLDPHGDLYANLILRVSSERLVCLDPDTNPPPLNFLDFGTSTEAQTLQTFSYLMSSLSGGLSDKQGAIVPYLLKLLRRIRELEGEASIETLRFIVDEKVKGVANSRYANAIASLPLVDQGFFHNQFYNSRMQETKDAIGWKLYSALSSDAFRQMFSAKTNSFDADAAMRDRKVVLVKGSRTALGDEGMQVFLQFIVAQFYSAALRRERLPPDRRHLCILFCDEAHHIFNPQTANILTECRKYGLGFLAATQVVQQIPDDVKAAIYGATAIKISGPVSHNDAMILAREMYTDSDFIRSMESVEGSHAYWAVHVAPNKKAYRVRVPYGALEAMPKSNVQPLKSNQQSTPQKRESGLSTTTPVHPKMDTSQTFQEAALIYFKSALQTIRQKANSLLQRVVQKTQKATPVQAPPPSPERPVPEHIARGDTPAILPRTHEAPEKGASRGIVSSPAKADTPTLPSPDDPSTPTKGRPF